MDLIARVAVAAATYAIDKPYDYLVPEQLAGRAQVGVRVMVPFGKGNRASEGVILALSEESRRPKLKALSSVLDESPVLGNEEIKLALWMRERYFCTLYDSVKALLPAGLWYRVQESYLLAVDRETALSAGKSDREDRVLETLASNGGTADLDTLRTACGEGASATLRELCQRGLVTAETTARRKIADKTVRRVTLAVSPEEAMAMAEAKRRSAPLRYEVVKLLCAIGSGLSSDICYFTGASLRTLKNLEQMGIAAFSQEEVFRVPQTLPPAESGPILLNEEQQAAYDAVLTMCGSGEPACALLYGVTGSGKTAVYLRLLQEVVLRGKQGMILVPEIALTPQMMARFSAYFGDRVMMLHSGLRMSERYDQWKRIRAGEADVVLGTRSAVFAPLHNLGMIIMDEEQEDSYQSENAPRYHARDVAKFRCTQSGAVLVLGSATPTV